MKSAHKQAGDCEYNIMVQIARTNFNSIQNSLTTLKTKFFCKLANNRQKTAILWLGKKYFVKIVDKNNFVKLE